MRLNNNEMLFKNQKLIVTSNSNIPTLHLSALKQKIYYY